jgi:hypothetical protein
LEVDRDDIVFFDAAPGRVRIEVTVWNRGVDPSAPTAATLMAAPLGAFVPWQPLMTLPVPAIEPGGSAVLRAEAARRTPRPLGPPDRVPPAPAPDGAGRRRRGARGPAPARGRTTAGGPSLPYDLFDLLRSGNANFAGNLNVFVAGRAVERHLARALRVYPGRPNFAMFVVGSGPDAYAFRLTGDGAGWGARLYDGTDQQSLAIDPRDAVPLAPDGWIAVEGQRMMFLVLEPPVDCPKGTVEVHVLQRSSGKRAVVEFDLDPHAAGPGCFVVP